MRVRVKSFNQNQQHLPGDVSYVPPPPKLSFELEELIKQPRASVSRRQQLPPNVISGLHAKQQPVSPVKARGPKTRVRHVPAPEKPPEPVYERQPELDPLEAQQQSVFEIRQKAAEARAKVLELCRTDVSAFCEYVLIDDLTGERIEQSQFHVQFQQELTKHRQIVVMSHPDSGKAMPLTTEVPTPHGWTTMGALKVGDRVFGSDGKSCLVTFVTPVQLNRRVFEVEFEDGVVIKADADHQWSIRKRRAPISKRVATTLEMAEKLRESDGHYVWSVPCTKPVQYQRNRLPVPAYVLGAWLGNGTSSNATLSFHEPDQFVWDQCVGFVGGRQPRPDKRNQVMYGTLGTEWGHIRGQLRRLGVLNNKHIPQCYLRASEHDRRQLLAGLLDTDGYCSPGSQIELTFCTKQLAYDSLELVRSLGFKATIAESDAKLNGRVVGTRWRIAFTAHEAVFQLPRKLAKQKLNSDSIRTKWKHIVAIREVASEPVRCIQVDSADHTYLCDRSYTVTHNTSQAVGRVLWELGRNPNLRVMILYNSEEAATNTLSTIRRYIESSKELREVFPHLKRGDLWKDDSITVARTAYSRDPSVRAVGYGSKRILGSRVDFLIIDDLLDSVVTATEAQRRKISAWVKNTVFSRLTNRAMVAFLTNAWHPRDLAHELFNDRGWHIIRRPIRDADGKIWWGVHWTEERLAEKRKTMGSLEYARSFDCDPRDDGSRVFRPEHIDYALKRGKNYAFVHGIDMMPDNCIIVTGVDLATGDDPKKQQGAKTVLTTVFFHPNQDRQVIRIRAGRWRATQILEEIGHVGQLFQRNHWIVVENNGVQRWILDLAQQHDLDVGITLVPFQTGRNKADPRFGVASLAAEFEARKWILPADCQRAGEQDDVESLMSQAIDYVPEAHTGDHLMSLWFAREIGRKIFGRYFGSGRTEGSSVRAIG